MGALGHSAALKGIGNVPSCSFSYQVNTHTIKAAEWERLRTGIALKTFTALITRYQSMSEKEEQNKLKEARRFAKGLFFNVREDPDR